MKPKTYKTAALAGLVLCWSFLAVSAQVRPEDKLFQEAKLLLFDEKWEPALGKLETLLGGNPPASLAAQALFYKGKCLSRLEGREPEAVSVFKDYLKLPDRNPNLAEEAEVTVIDLAYGLYVKGNRSYLREIESRLENPNRVVRYYAAFKLSYARDRSVAVKSLPVLKSILSAENDSELRDRAKIALMRVDPQALKSAQAETSEGSSRPRLLRLEIMEEGRNKVSLSIPWALADLAIQAIPEKEKQVLRQKGYDLERILRELENVKSSIIEIKDDESRTRIKLWID